MIDARIPVEMGLKGHFGSILVAIGSSTSAKSSSTSANLFWKDSNPIPT
jgi:hypothetical protein